MDLQFPFACTFAGSCYFGLAKFKSKSKRVKIKRVKSKFTELFLFSLKGSYISAIFKNLWDLREIITIILYVILQEKNKRENSIA